MNNGSKPWFCECIKCGERWKAATLPMGVAALKAFKPKCPNCGERKRLFMCVTEGPTAITEPRDGKADNDTSGV